MKPPVYVVAARHRWNKALFKSRLSRLPGRWVLVDSPRRMTRARMDALGPKVIFFLHWSWRVPAAILGRYECIGFHMTDLPYGRGGSPLQNLIARGHRRSVLSCFRLTETMDAGPVYRKKPLSLDGTAQKIYERASRLAVSMIVEHLRRPAAPRPQRGRVTVFSRRRPAQSRITAAQAGLRRLYDFLRMLDADGYPRAYCKVSDWKIEFSHPTLRNGRLSASATFMRETD